MAEERHASHRQGVATATKRVLLVAYHFPPDASSTGRLRTLGFARHLPAFGWQASVLSADPRAYERVDMQGVDAIPEGANVTRAFALDTRRHLGWRGRYLSWLATPDRWISWWPAAVIAGLRLIRRERIDAIWSTYPIATTHLIGQTLARRTGLPWIADFRDPVAPAGTAIQRRFQCWIEGATLARADRIVFTTPGARERYAERFPQAEVDGRLAHIANGFDDSLLDGIERKRAGKADTRPLQLVHSGKLYSQGRNPAHFFDALARLKRDATIDARQLTIVLRASGDEAAYQSQLDALDIGDLVQLAPPVAYRDALAEQDAADGLLLFQGREFNAQIPAKVYEYLHIGRPILALTDPIGDTARLLADSGGAEVAPLDDADAIRTALARFIDSVRSHTFKAANAQVVQSFSRLSASRQLAHLLDDIGKTK